MQLRCIFWDIDHDSRPLLRPGLPPEEFDRWYWLAAELRAGATALGIPATGRKQELATRIRCALAGEPPPPQVRRAGTDGLTGDLDLSTPVPAGQRLTRRLREFMVAQCGPSFRFTAELRAFFAGDGDRTLADAVELWQRGRSVSGESRAAGRPSRAPIAEQFEYNRFNRAWRAANPGGSHAEMVAAWRAHRAQPRA